MTSGVDVMIRSLAFGALTGVLLFIYALYLLANSLLTRAIWEEHATFFGKTKTVIKYVYRNANWRHAPETFRNGFLVGLIAAFILQLLWIGFSVAFL